MADRDTVRCRRTDTGQTTEYRNDVARILARKDPPRAEVLSDEKPRRGGRKKAEVASDAQAGAEPVGE